MHVNKYYWCKQNQRYGITPDPPIHAGGVHWHANEINNPGTLHYPFITDSVRTGTVLYIITGNTENQHWKVNFGQI